MHTRTDIPAATALCLGSALDWPLAHVGSVLEHAAASPHLGGPLLLRRVPPPAYTTAPRIDILTARQQQALASVPTARDTLTPDQATVLLPVMAFGQRPRYASYRETCPHTEHTLKQAGLIRSHYGPTTPNQPRRRLQPALPRTRMLTGNSASAAPGTPRPLAKTSRQPLTETPRSHSICGTDCIRMTG